MDSTTAHTPTEECPRVGERVTYKVGRRTMNATVTRGPNEAGQVAVVDDGDQTGTVRRVAPALLTVHAPDIDQLHADALYLDQLLTELASATPSEDLNDCPCVEFCNEDPKTACSLSGIPHVHPEIPGMPGVYGPCPVHPERPGDQ
jgi:hypothetical protein